MSDKSRNTAHARALSSLLDDLGHRPLSTRSLLLSLLLGTHPPELPVHRLVAFGELFGLRPGTVRTALSRMAASGEVDVDDARYRLTGRLLDRQQALDAGRREVEAGWSGEWWTVIVGGGERTMAARRHFRTTMDAARMGELRPDLWMRPDNLPSPSTGPDVLVTRGRLTSGDDVALARRLWDVDVIEHRSSRLLDAIERVDDLLQGDAAGVLPTAFDVSVAAVRHLRADPQLPVGLVPMPASRALRRSYERVNERFRQAMADWATGETLGLDGPNPQKMSNSSRIAAT